MTSKYCKLFVSLFLLLPVSLHAQRQMERQGGKHTEQKPLAPAESAPKIANTVVTGTITSIVVDDPSSQPNTSRDARRFAVRITLDSVQGTILGFAPVNDKGPVEMQQALLDTALLAFEHNMPVALQLENPLSNQTNTRARDAQTRSHVRIVGIMLKRP